MTLEYLSMQDEMHDELRSPIKHHLLLHRVEPRQGIRRFYSLMIECDPFGTVRLLRNWDRIGTKGRSSLTPLPTRLRRAKRLRG
jgi:predicted DNA-binding WGR domain protein